jgi:hypothetical protein
MTLPYIEEVAPTPDWADDDITAEKLIRSSLALAQEQHVAISPTMRDDMKLTRGSIEHTAAVRLTNLCVMNFVSHAMVADLMIAIKDIAPDKADEIATRFVNHTDSGDYYPEQVWHWLTERNIDPERIRTETLDKLTPTGEPR